MLNGNERPQGKTVQPTQQNNQQQANNNQQQSSNQQSQNNNNYMTQDEINEWNKTNLLHMMNLKWVMDVQNTKRHVKQANKFGMTLTLM